MIELKYQLSRKEIEESLLCQNWKKEGMRKVIHVYSLSLIGLVLLILYIRQPQQLMFLFSLMLTVFLALAVIFVPIRRRKRNAERILCQKGIYHIQINKEGIKAGKNYLFSPAETVVLESEQVYTIQIKRDFFCIPKRILNSKNRKEVQEIINCLGCTIQKFKTREG